jgi:hypothetical protein
MMTMPNPDPNKTGSVKAWHAPAGITISVHEPVDGRDAKAQLEFIVENNDDDSNFQLVDRSTVEVAGITAQQATYYASGPLLFKGAPGRLIRTIYFDHGGYVWKMESFSEEVSISETVAEDFEYVLSTFRILE